MDAICFSNWIIQNSPGPITQLKLQKLLFYCYGAIVASDFDNEVDSNIFFQAWEYGPVVPEVWNAFKQYGREEIPSERHPSTREFSRELSIELKSLLAVYGQLSAGQLVQETHFEQPWIQAWTKGDLNIEKSSLRNYFRKKFKRGFILPPKLLSNTATLTIDRIPVRGQDSFSDLARLYPFA